MRFEMKKPFAILGEMTKGTDWRAPLVLVVLVAFAAGLVAGVLAMVPRWLKQRNAANRARLHAASDSQQFQSTLSAPHGP